MIVETQSSSAGDNGPADIFPVGMRVLAVDDDPICLKVLENLLRRCKYRVTTTNQAIQALKMLRENRNMFDLVISDVNMPDMDGFKLLELLGLEMDLPVIMLSAHSDTKLVMKGVTHGACDYLLKPVRIEELKNIWQHVIRRRKFDSKGQNNSTNQNSHRRGNSESEQAFSSTDNGENAKLNRKRKDQKEGEGEEGEENERENEDPSTQKKPRVVWSVELHRKFVAAVHQLGVDKAVPKKILDLMNVEGLTRENVASHLQKYRLYLQRISSVASQQDNIAAALGVKDASFMRVGKIDGFGDLCSLAGNGSFSNAPLSSYTPCGMIGRLNTPAGLTLHGITSSRLIQQSNSRNFNNPVNALGKIEPVMLSSNETHTIFQGIPTPLQLGQLQPGKSSSVMKEFNPINDELGFTLLDDSISASPLIMQGNTARGGFGAESFAKVASLNQESLVGGINGSSHNIDHNRCDESWNRAFQTSKFPSNPFENYSHDRLTSNNMCRAPVDFSSTCAVSDPTQNSIDEREQQGFIGNFVQTTSVLPRQRVEENKHDFHLNHTFRALDCIGPGFLGSGSSAEQNDTASRKMFDVSSNSHLTTGETLLYAQHGNNLLHQAKSRDGVSQSNYQSFDDIMNAMIKLDHNEMMTLTSGGFGFNTSPFRS